MEERLRKITAEESYRKGLRAALDWLREHHDPSNGHNDDMAKGWNSAADAIERLLEAGKERGEHD